MDLGRVVHVETKTTTDASGNYRVLNLPIGSYTVTAEHTGFSKLVTAPVKLEINEQEKEDLRLEVGAVNQVVEVSDVSDPVVSVVSVFSMGGGTPMSVVDNGTLVVNDVVDSDGVITNGCRCRDVVVGSGVQVVVR